MEHSKMDHSRMDHSKTAAVDHSKMDHAAMGHQMSPPAPEPPIAAAQPGQPAASLRGSELDAPAEIAVREAERAAALAKEMASGGHSMMHPGLPYQQTDAGRDSVTPPAHDHAVPEPKQPGDPHRMHQAPSPQSKRPPARSSPSPTPDPRHMRQKPSPPPDPHAGHKPASPRPSPSPTPTPRRHHESPR
jgi:hypothetical protein